MPGLRLAVNEDRTNNVPHADLRGALRGDRRADRVDVVATRKGKTSATTAPPDRPTARADRDSFAPELLVAGNRAQLVARIERLRAALEELGLDDDDRELIELGRGAKKNFAQRFSNAIAKKTADALRPRFPGIFPDEAGRGQESRSAGAGGLKKLDVNYSTPQIGLGLAISIKTINFRDDATRRYTKNVKRVDGELRAEAQDCHERQPFAVLAVLLFVPADAAHDGALSSLKHAANVLAARSNRGSHREPPSLFEAGFIATYSDEGVANFYPARPDFPATGVPAEAMTFSEVLERVTEVFRARNAK